MKKLILIFTLIIGTHAIAQGIQITNPKGGWRDSSKKRVKFSQSINYPDVQINMPEDQPDFGKIEGQILNSIRNSPKLLNLVVNGVSMPLKTSNGKFSRPYAFPNGANNIEIRTQDGKKKSTVQFYDTKKGGTPARIRVVLSWDTDGTDLDLHVVNPKGNRCYYGKRKLKDGSALDVDVTTGYGPEIFSSPGTEKGPYLIYVNYYGRTSSEEVTTAKVAIITNEGTVDEKVEVKRVPLRKPGELTLISSFVYL